MTPQTLILYLLSVFTTAAGVYALFKATERVATDDARRIISRWLIDQLSRGPSIARQYEARWASIVGTSFDQFFGTGLISWKRLRNSWAISTGSVVAMTILWASLRPQQFSALLEHTQRDISGLFAGVIISAYALNLIPDYFSAIQTRFFIRLMTEARSLGLLVLLIIGDVVFTLTLFSIFYLLFLSFFDVLYGVSEEIRAVWKVLEFSSLSEALVWLAKYGPRLTVGEPGSPSIGIFLYSTFFASAWMWSFLLVSLMLRAFGVMLLRATLLSRFIDLEARPLQSMGFLMSVALVVVGLLLAPLIL